MSFGGLLVSITQVFTMSLSIYHYNFYLYVCVCVFENSFIGGNTVEACWRKMQFS